MITPNENLFSHFIYYLFYNYFVSYVSGVCNENVSLFKYSSTLCLQALLH